MPTHLSMLRKKAKDLFKMMQNDVQNLKYSWYGMMVFFVQLHHFHKIFFQCHLLRQCKCPHTVQRVFLYILYMFIDFQCADKFCFLVYYPSSVQFTNGQVEASAMQKKSLSSSIIYCNEFCIQFLFFPKEKEEKKPLLCALFLVS